MHAGNNVVIASPSHTLKLISILQLRLNKTVGAVSGIQESGLGGGRNTMKMLKPGDNQKRQRQLESVEEVQAKRSSQKYQAKFEETAYKGALNRLNNQARS